VQNSDENYITEYKVFGTFDKLRPTATGLDGLPAWFLRTGAPIFGQPLITSLTFHFLPLKYHVSGNKLRFAQFPKLLSLPNMPIFG